MGVEENSIPNFSKFEGNDNEIKKNLKEIKKCIRNEQPKEVFQNIDKLLEYFRAKCKTFSIKSEEYKSENDSSESEEMPSNDEIDNY